MQQKIDLKFVAGLLIGAVVMGVVVIVLMSGGGDDDRAAKARTSPTTTQEQDGAEADGAETEDSEEGGSGSSAGPPWDAAVPDGPGKIGCPAATRTVRDATGLHEALGAVQPGEVIGLANGTYEGRFVARTSGTQDKPIFLCGSTAAVIDGGGVKKGYAFHLNKVNHWRLVGFTVRNSQKGVMADTTNASIVQGLDVHDIGDEGIHLRNFSSGNQVQYNKIYNTGLRREKFGEGVYLGSAESNWAQFSGGKMDRSDHNIVRGNVIRATAEAIDIKEGTTGGRIVGNVFDGSALGGSKHNDSWVDVKGNGYVIEGNRGRKTNEDGFQTHEIVEGWGTGNVFRGNTIDLAGGGGVGVNDTAGGNTIDCNNKVTGGGLTKKGRCS